MKEVKIICDWDLSFSLHHEKQIEVWVDQNPYPNNNPEIILIGVLIEPEEIRQSMGMKTFLDRFDYILTHDQRILDSHKNAFLYEFGMCWTDDYKFGEKVFGISTLIGGKKMAPGHYLRLQLFERETEIKTPSTFWISKNFPPGYPRSQNPVLSGTKSQMFDKQFHICIENVKKKNWFTEKLIDCLNTKTVPIYYGCPNIGDWFDTRGFIMVDNLDDIIRECNRLTPETYGKMEAYIEENHRRAKNYSDIGINIKRSIESNIIPLIR